MAYENELTTAQERLHDQLKLIAENDGDAYRAHQPSQAVQRAFRQLRKSVMEKLQEDFDAVQLDLCIDLNERWKETHK